LDVLHLQSLAFPVLRGSLSKTPGVGDYCWSIEIHCGESARLYERNNSDDQDEDELDWLAGTEPYLYAQLLPLRVPSPDQLVGRRYSFPQSPEDEPADWEPDQWPFFCLYLYEHEYLYPVNVGFTEQRGGRYKVEIAGKYPVGARCYDLKVQAWLDWDEC
jgi:hypothetical protein